MFPEDWSEELGLKGGSSTYISIFTNKIRIDKTNFQELKPVQCWENSESKELIFYLYSYNNTQCSNLLFH